jgi:uncharacterized protein (TIRG00374 family)
LLLRITGSVVALALLLALLPRQELWAALRELPVAAWPLSVGVYLGAHLLGVVKWRLLVNSAGAGLGARRATRAYYWGLFGNLFLPSIVGGDVVRAGVAFNVVRSRTGLLLGSLVDRVQDVVGLVVLAALGAMLSPRALDAQSARIFTWFLLLFGSLALAGGMALFLFPFRRLPFRLRRKLVLVRRALVAAASRPARLAAAFGLGLALQSALIVLNWSLGRAIGIDIPLYVWFFVWPLAKIAALLPVTQGGVGVREAAQAALFAPFGVGAVMAVAVGLVFEAVLFTGGLVSAAISLALRERLPGVTTVAALGPSSGVGRR